VATFVTGQPITTEQPFIDVDAGLSVGTHRFQLVVVDTQGNRSAPDIQTVIISRLPITPPVVGPTGPVIPIDPVAPIRPVSPIEPIRPIGTTTPTPVRSPQGATKPQGRKRPRRGGTQ
jgi:hypothetical protein